VAPTPPSDLIRLLRDDEGRTRRRAALAAGRVGLPEAVPALQQVLGDPEPEVRQMAAFALGLIGDASARGSLLEALKDADPIVQGRAAEALGTIGDKADAAAIAAMAKAHVLAGALANIAADDMAWPLTPEAEASRLGLYALVRLGSFDAVASVALDASGAPVSSWWPVAYALGRVGDARAIPALVSLLATPGRFTAAFAARGLAALKAPSASAALREIVARRDGEPAVLVQAVRALGASSDAASAPLLEAIVTNGAADATLRSEAAMGLAAIHTPGMLDFVIDMLSDRAPAIRGAALRALAMIDGETFLTTLSGLDPDPDWTVRQALAEALAKIPEAQGAPRLVAMVADRDLRVVGTVLGSLVSAKAPAAAGILQDHLKNPDAGIRAAAASGLAQLKVGTAVPALVDAYRATTADATSVARTAILAAIDALDPATARPLAQDALKDGNWAVRVEAAGLMRDQGASNQVIRPAPARPMNEVEWQALLAPQFSPHAFIDTDKGTIEIELAIADAPMTVSNFMTLARKGFFNGVAFHRVVPDFVVQGGDPRGDGEGGPGYTIRDELNQRPYLRGTVGMALDGKDTGGSQFFVTHSPQPHLDARYTAFGHVVAGMEVVDRIEPWDVIRRVQVWDGVTLR